MLATEIPRLLSVMRYAVFLGNEMTGTLTAKEIMRIYLMQRVFRNESQISNCQVAELGTSWTQLKASCYVRATNGNNEDPGFYSNRRIPARRNRPAVSQLWEPPASEVRTDNDHLISLSPQNDRKTTTRRIL